MNEGRLDATVVRCLTACPEDNKTKKYGFLARKTILAHRKNNERVRDSSRT
jgi:hypothetical protein